MTTLHQVSKHYTTSSGPFHAVQSVFLQVEIVIVTHDMDVVRSICSRVSEMRDGRLLSTQPVGGSSDGSKAGEGEAHE